MKHLKAALIAGILIILLGFSVLAAGIWKVNRKINLVGEDTGLKIQELQAAQAQAGQEEENIRCSYIPDLQTHDGGWKVTQFGDVMQNQEMCYTITTDTGLVIVDGGYAYEEPRLRKIIAQYGNSVEAWILTHPHEDHITAFLDIYEDPQGIQINHIYTAEMPDMDTLNENASWDNYTQLERFRNLDIPQLEYLQTGDELDLMGLEMEVLSAYSDLIDEMSDDLMNDGSMMFRISGKEDSMLFCADVGSAGDAREQKIMSDYLIRTYKDDLASTYVQLAHHGFGGLNNEFYQTVNPKAVFFDAPYWLMNGESDRFHTLDRQEMVKEMGIASYTYYTAPNQILLR